MPTRRRPPGRPSDTTATSRLGDPARASRERYLEHQVRKLEEAAEEAAAIRRWSSVVQARSKAADLRGELEQLRQQRRDREKLRRRAKRQPSESWDPNEPESSRMQRRIARLYQQIEAAQTAGNHAAVASLMRQVSMAEGELARLSGPPPEPEGDLTEADEEAYLAEIRASADAMPEPHLRVFVDAWMERHKMLAVPRSA